VPGPAGPALPTPATTTAPGATVTGSASAPIDIHVTVNLTDANGQPVSAPSTRHSDPTTAPRPDHSTNDSTLPTPQDGAPATTPEPSPAQAGTLGTAWPPPLPAGANGDDQAHHQSDTGSPPTGWSTQPSTDTVTGTSSAMVTTGTSATATTGAEDTHHTTDGSRPSTATGSHDTGSDTGTSSNDPGTDRTPDAKPPAKNVTGWHSGASGDEANTGTFGSWRGSPVTIIGTWNDTTDAVERAQASVGEISQHYHGDMDVSVGGLQSQGAGETWAQAAQGKYLDRWTEIVKNLAAARRGAKGVTYVRFAHEMNGDWYDWKVGTKDVDDFKKSWRMFHDLLKKEFPQAQLVFSPNSASHNGIGIDQIWPGDDLVDVVGVDFYDGWPRFNDQATWDQHYNDHELGNSPVGIGAWLDFAKSHHMGLSFPEWGLNPAAGNTDNPFFIKAMHDFFAKHAAGQGDPSGRVLYDIYFNCEVDGFKITSSQNSTAGKVYRSLTWGNTILTSAPTPRPVPASAPASPTQQQTTSRSAPSPDPSPPPSATSSGS
jgi:beta-mannanase